MDGVISMWSEPVITFRGEFAGLSTNSAGDMKLNLFVDRADRSGLTSTLADTAGYIMEFRVYQKPKASRRQRHDGLIDLPDAEVPE